MSFIFFKYFYIVPKDILRTGCEDVCGIAPEPNIKEIDELRKVLERRKRDIKNEVWKYESLSYSYDID